MKNKIISLVLLSCMSMLMFGNAKSEERRMKKKIGSKIISWLLVLGMLVSPLLQVQASTENDNNEVSIPNFEEIGEVFNFYDGSLSDEEIQRLSEESMLQGMRSRAATVNVRFEVGERINYGSWSTNIMYMIVDGNRNIAYCLEPAKGTPMNGDYAGQVLDSNANLRKGLYYAYGGPGYAEYRSMYGNLSGTGTFHDEYVASHVILSYLYDSSGSAFLGMDSEWVTFLRGRIDRMLTMPEPPNAEIRFDKPTLTATFDVATGMQRTDTQRLIGDSRNTLTIPLPTGVTLHNTTANTSRTGNVAIKGGDSFYLTGTALSTNALNWSSGSLYGSLTNQWRSLLMQTTGGLQDIGSWAVSREPVAPASFRTQFNAVGQMTLTKKSTNELWTNNNLYYTLQGARFAIKDNAGNVVDTVTTNASGQVISRWLLQGNYTIEEIEVPVGYLKAANINATLNSTNRAVTINEQPQAGRIVLQKVDKDTGEAVPQGNAVIEGAEYSLTYERGGITTNEVGADGRLMFDNLPLGKYKVQEVTAPQGYELDPTIYEIEIASEDRETEVFIYNVRSEEAVSRGGVEVEKRDFELDRAVPQGNATLRLTAIEIINRSRNTVVVDGVTYGTNEVVHTLITDVNGRAKTANDLLPYGQYEIREKTPPNGYTPEGIISRTFAITRNGEIVDLTSIDTAIKNNVIRGGVSIEKWDIELDAPQAQGAGTLQGAKFAIINDSRNAVLVDDVLYEPNAVVKTIVTDADFTATTSKYLLPYGNYRIEEIGAPEGYLLKGELNRRFTIATQGEVVEMNTADTAIKNAPLRADLRLVKVEDATMRRMGNIPFSITSKTTGESHIIITDRNGMASTESSWNPHTQHTNRGETSRDGVWFGAGDVDDTVGALLYDTYIIDELPCEENEGKILIQGVEVVVDRNEVTIDLGTITNDEIPTLEVENNKKSDEEKIVEVTEVLSPSIPQKESIEKTENIPRTGDTKSGRIWLAIAGGAVGSILVTIFWHKIKQRDN